MRNATCFRCQRNYKSDNEDDLAGDGRCKSCEELAKKAAFEVDIKISQLKRLNPIPQVSKNKEWIEKGGQINARDLGIHFGN